MVSSFKDMKDEIITLLKTDSDLAKHGYYYSLFEVTTSTPKPCTSVDLDVDKDADTEHTGGFEDNYVAEGMVISYFDPNTQNLTEKLDNTRWTQRQILKDAMITGDLTEISEIEYTRSYLMPWTVQTNNGPKILSHRVITEFKAYYEVERT